MNTYVFLLVLFLFGALCLWLGQRSSRGLEGRDDYFLMGRSLGLFPLTITMLATQLGGGIVMGAADQAYQYGWSVLFYPAGATLGLLLLGFGFGARLRALNLATISEIFSKKYRSPALQQFAGTLSVVSLFLILVAQGIAARSFFAALGQPTYLFVGLWLVLVFYTVIGGIKAVIQTDILQAVFILFALALAYSSTSTDVTSNVTSASINDIPWTGWLLMPLMFMFIEQDMGQRCFAAKSPKIVSRAAILAALVLFIAALVPVYFGVLASNSGLAIEPGQSVLIVALQAFTGPIVSALFMCAILMVIISTADSILCSVASNLAYDFPALRQTNSLRWSQVITFLVGTSSLALSCYYDDVVGVLIFSYELSVSCLFVPVVIAAYATNPSRYGAFGSVAAGALGLAIGIGPILTLALSVAGYGAGNLFTSRLKVKTA